MVDKKKSNSSVLSCILSSVLTAVFSAAFILVLSSEANAFFRKKNQASVDPRKADSHKIEAEISQALSEKNVFNQLYAPEFTSIINELQLKDSVDYILSTHKADDNCLAMMDSKLVTGQLGQTVAQLFVEKSKAGLLPLLTNGGLIYDPVTKKSTASAGSVAQTCKAYPTLTVEQKANVWVLVLTSMAHFESQCRDKVAAQGPNGIAIGYYQLHKGKEHTYVQTPGFCEKNAGTSPKKASLCALGMLERQFSKNKNALFSSKSYWDVLRPYGVKRKSLLIRQALSKSSLCTVQGI